MNSVVVNYTEGKILKPLIKFSLPILLSIIIQSLYGAIDLLIVGRFGSSADVSAVAIGSQLMQTITGFITGLTMGVTILTGQYIGMKKYEEAGKTIGSSVFLFTVFAIILTIINVSFSKTAVIFMQTPPEALEKAYSYVLICSIGTIFIVAYNMISSIFRGLGNSNLPLIFVSIAAIANIFGDLFFVAVLNLNTAGAAIATVIAQAISVVLSFIIIRRKKLPFEFNKSFIKFDKAKTLRVLKLGSPIALQDSLTHISFLIIIAIVNGLGLIRSAGVGVAEKAVIFMLMIPLTFMSSISAFTAQNIGAKKYSRARKSLVYGVVISLLCGFIIGTFAYFRGDILISLFTKDIAVIAEGQDFLRATAIESVIASTTFCLLGYFNGNGKTLFVMLQSIAAAFLVRIPFSFIMSKKPDVSMFEMGLAAPVAAFFSLVVSIIYLIYIERKRKLSSLQFI